MVHKIFLLNVVSVEREIFSGKASKLIASGAYGEFEVLYNHSAFLTTLSSGHLWYTDEFNEVHGIVVFGGLIEVQPYITTVLTDSFLRKEDIDEEEVLRIKKNIEQTIVKGVKGYDYAKARVELSKAIAQLTFLRKYKSMKKI